MPRIVSHAALAVKASQFSFLSKSHSLPVAVKLSVLEFQPFEVDRIGVEYGVFDKQATAVSIASDLFAKQ